MGIHEFEHEQQLQSDALDANEEGIASTTEAGADDAGADDAVVANGLAKAVLKERPPYASNKQSVRIRHAMTGAWYEHRVGSKDEHRYFKVHDATSNNKYGCGNVYFFDSPGDYENYGGTVSERVVKDWVARRGRVFA